MQPAMPVRILALLALALLGTLAGCATQGGSAPASVDRAERLLRRGDSAGAAQMYEELARQNPAPARNDLVLAAARAWLAANRADDAQRALDLAGAAGSTAQRLDLGMLRAQVAAARGQSRVAWQQISQLAQPEDHAAAARLLQLRQQIALQAGEAIEAVRAGVARERIATSDEERTSARRDLLTGLRSAIEGGLRINPAATSDALVRGWLELAQIAVSAARAPLTAEADIARWRQRFPAHPGATIIDRDILHPAERPGQVRTGPVTGNGPVALLLPLSSPQSEAAVAAALIRDGFQAAIGRLPEAERPVVRIYDTAALQVGTALQNAQADGANFIVGPLLKDDVLAAYQQRPGSLPLLLLNTLPNGGGGQTFQFALAPEDEARQIARQIAGSGRGNAVVLTPANEWGQRVAQAFTEELTRAGGKVVAQGTYDMSKNDLATGTPVTVALGIDDSRARGQRVQALIGTKVEFEPQPRPDIDAVFAAGYQPLALPQLNSLLQNYAADLPVYITEDGLAASSAENRDLAGARVLDTPWTLDSVGPVADLRTATEPQWRTQGPRESRYFAFGYDAATLSIALRRGGASWPLAGLTGSLQLTPEGRIERGLDWARLTKDGELKPFDPLAN